MNIWKVTFEESGQTRQIDVEGMWITDAINAIKNGNYNVDIAFCHKIELIGGER